MIEDMVATLQPAATKNGNTLEVRVAEDTGSMRADITKVRQILFNLLSNACKFTDHGTIRFEAERTLAKGKEWIRFRVIDTGIGITAEQQLGLFQEFAQADTSIARKYGGTGLGLAISHRFAQMMKGQIRVISQPGQGSTFTVELPAHVTVEPVDPAQQANAGHGTQTPAPELAPGIDTILVIDDDASVRDLMSRFLTKLGFNVVAAGSGDEGLRLARQIMPRVITLDVMMPGINGWDVLSELKADPELSQIPVIMVTIVDNEVMGLDMGASNYLVKPIDRERLALLIDKYRVASRPRSADHTETGQYARATQESPTQAAGTRRRR